MKRNQVEVLFKLIMFTSSIASMALISALYPIYANIPLIVIPSILVLLLAKPVFFEKLKLSTLVIMRILIIFAALGLINTQLYVNLILWMLIINILEATFTDLLKHKKYYNAISGFAVAIGVFALSGFWVNNAIVGNYYLVNGYSKLITFLYVIAYTIWNWIFVTNEFSSSVSLMHIGFLSAPLIGCLCTSWMNELGGIGMWLLLRANSLSIGGWLQIGAKNWFENEFFEENFNSFVNWTKGKNIQILFMLINVLLIGIVMYLSYINNTLAIPKIF